MKRATLIVLVILTGFVSAPARAQSVGQSEQIISSLTPLMPLPPPPCPPTPTYSWCDSIKQQIIVFNGYIKTYNQTLIIAQRNLQYLRYGAQFVSFAKQDSANVKSIIAKTQDLSWANVNADQIAGQTVAGITGATPPATVDAMVQKQLEQSIKATLLQMGLINANDNRDENTVATIDTAAANVKNPTEAAQMNVHLLAIIANSISRLEQLDNVKINTEFVKGQTEVEREQKAAAVRDAQLQQTIQQIIPNTPPSTPPPAR